MASNNKTERQEIKFIHNNNKFQYKLQSMRNKLLGGWAASFMYNEPEKINKYIEEVVAADLEVSGDEDVISKIFDDLNRFGHSISREVIKTKIIEFEKDAAKEYNSCYNGNEQLKKKILIVKYLPSGNNSSTKILLDHFLEKCSLHEVQQLDLIEQQPPFFKNDSLLAYQTRNYMAKPLTQSQKESIKPFDDLISQVKWADILVIACPMHNFSYPGIVKTYFDAIMFHNETFRMGGPNDGGKKNIGLMEGKKALTIFTAGGFYPENSEYSYLNNVKTLSNIEFNFMGYSDIKTIYASTANPETKQQNIDNAKEQLSNLVKEWQS